VSTTIRSSVRWPAAGRELLHRHVLLRAGEGGGQRLVERGWPDLLGPLGRRVRDDDLVERPLHVQHHRVQLARGPWDLDRRGCCPARPGRGLRQPARARVDGGGRDDRCGPASAGGQCARAGRRSSSCPRPPAPQHTMIGCRGRRFSAASPAAMAARAGESSAAGARAGSGASTARPAHAATSGPQVAAPAARESRTARRVHPSRASSGRSTVGGERLDLVAQLVLAPSGGRGPWPRRRARRPGPGTFMQVPPRPARGRGPRRSGTPAARDQGGLGQGAGSAGHVPRRADRQADALRSAIASGSPATGMSSSSVTRCTAVCGEPEHGHHAVALGLDRAGAGSPAISPVTLRKRVIRPVGGASTTTAS
jgi:hypothetical protein